MGLSLAAVVVALAVALSVVLVNRPASAQTLTLQPAGSTGPHPFTGSVAKGATPSASTPASPSASTGTTQAGQQVVSGSTVGLYGGTEHLSSCDVAQLSAFLTANPDKGRAWASVEGITPADIPAYLRSLTAVVLRADTWVTNHGYSNGAATSFQSVLQAGTAVLVDSRGVPRARCACGNPLLPPSTSNSSVKFTGTGWSSFQSERIVVVEQSVQQLTVIVLFDPNNGTWFTRPTGGTGGGDHRTTPPSPSASASKSASASRSSGMPCVSGSVTASGSGSACPSSSAPSTPASASSSAASSSAPPSSTAPSSSTPSSAPPPSSLAPVSSAAVIPAGSSDETGASALQSGATGPLPVGTP